MTLLLFKWISSPFLFHILSFLFPTLSNPISFLEQERKSSGQKLDHSLFLSFKLPADFEPSQKKDYTVREEHWRKKCWLLKFLFSIDFLYFQREKKKKGKKYKKKCPLSGFGVHRVGELNGWRIERKKKKGSDGWIDRGWSLRNSLLVP